MAKKEIDNEPKLEENSSEILLEETSGTEAMLEESIDNEVLLEEIAAPETVMLEETQEESVLLEETSPVTRQSGPQPSADATATVAQKPKARKVTTRKPKAQASTSNNASTTSNSKSKNEAEVERRRSAAQKTQTSVSSNNNSIDLPFWGLAFAWGLPIAVVLMGWIYSFFDDDSHGLGYYLFLFLICAIPVNFFVARDEDLHKGQRKYFYIPLIILVLISGISIWWGISSLKNQPATKETYTYINNNFYVKNHFVVDVNEGDTLLKPDGQGLCELGDDGTLYERIKPKYDSIGYFAKSTNDVEMFIIKQDGKYGLVDKEDEKLVEPKYMRIEASDEELMTQDGIKLFKAYTDNSTDLYSYEPKYYGQMQNN